MIKTSALLILIALRLMYQPSAAQQDIPAFSGQQEAIAAANNAIRIAKETKYPEFAKQNEEILIRYT